MAKKKKSVLKKGDSVKKMTEAAKDKPAAGPANAPGKNKFIFFAVVAALIVLAFAEIVYVSKKSVMKSKKPEFIRMWDHRPYTGIAFLKAYAGFLYGVDDTGGKVIKFDRISGKVVNVFDLKEALHTFAEDADGNVYILDKKGVIHKFNKKYDPVEKVTMPGGINPAWLEIDSRNNFLLVDGLTMTVHKFDSSFKRLLFFGGKGGAKNEFNVLIKIFAGPDDDIYCLSGADAVSQKKVSIFSKTGQLKKSWPLKGIKKFSRLDHLAVTPEGYVYMNSDTNNMIYVFSNNGTPLSEFNSCKDNSCALTYPGCIAGGMNGELYICTHQVVAVKNIKY